MARSRRKGEKGDEARRGAPSAAPRPWESREEPMGWQARPLRGPWVGQGLEELSPQASRPGEDLAPRGLGQGEQELGVLQGGERME